MSVKAKKLKEAIDHIPDDADLIIGVHREEYPVEEVFISTMNGKVIFASKSYENWMRKKE